MERANKFLHSIFEVSHVEFQSYDLTNQKLIFSSGLAHKLLGYSPKEYYTYSDHYYKDLVHPDDWSIVLEAIDKVYKAKDSEVVEMTIRMRQANGNYIWVYSRQMILDRANGNGQHCSIIREVEDITKFRELQVQFFEKVEQLQNISYKNSHLLRSPVSSIIGLLNLIEEENTTSQHNLLVFNYLKQTIGKLDDIIREINEDARHD